MKNVFKWNDRCTSWKYIEEFYSKDQLLKNRIAPKLTKSHLQPTNFEKMRVKFATQVLSASVAAGLETYILLGSLPQKAIGTKDFVARFDKLFDLFNSSQYGSPKQFHKPFSGAPFKVEFLEETLIFLDKLLVFNKDGKNVTNYMKFINCWKITINALREMHAVLKEEGFRKIVWQCKTTMWKCP
jgi:hypothetical protein